MILAKGILPASIIKRDGASAPFAPDKIRSAIVRAGRATQEFDGSEAESLTAAVLQVLEHRHAAPLTVEQTQDVVEQVLISADHFKTALYRYAAISRSPPDRAVRRHFGAADADHVGSIA